MIDQIKYVDEIRKFKLPTSDFLVVNSAWLVLMGIRINGDFDMIMSKKLRGERFPDVPLNESFGLPGRLELRLRILADDHRFGTMFGAKDLDDVISNYGIEIDDMRFIQPRFYFELKAWKVATSRQKLENAPFWKRWLHRYRFKHERDFRVLDRYLAAGKHLDPKFSMVPADAWVGPEALKFLPRYAAGLKS